MIDIWEYPSSGVFRLDGNFCLSEHYKRELRKVPSGPRMKMANFSRLPFMYQSIPKSPVPPPQANPGAFDFFEKFWSNSPLCCRFDGQMPHPLELQRGSNPPPCHAMQSINEYKQNRLPLETSFAKFSVTTNFLFNLSLLHTLNKGIFHDITI